MKNYNVHLESEVSNSFRCVKAANSLDIDSKKKSVHEFQIEAEITEDFNIGLIVGASGSGKTTLAESVWGEMNNILADDLPVIDQFPDSMTYEECAKCLTGVGLTSVPCWIRPVYTLSNGQKARAEVALRLAGSNDLEVIDEWTSVVDRTVAKVMSHCVHKYAKKSKRKIVLLSCHYDVIDWLQPDWIIDCNKQTYEDRRLLQQSRKEILKFDIREVSRKSWKYFSKYHYLSDKLAGGHIETFGLFHNDEQIGFACYANYVPWGNKLKKEIMHANRIVVHPDYCGLGLGIHLFSETAKIMVDRNYQVMSKFSSEPVAKAMTKHPHWELKKVQRAMKTIIGGNMLRDSGFREKVKTYSFAWIGGGTDNALHEKQSN
tara:strand:+ start:472 stop:1596 length:1125 start_codon:yes stop_codon:yes gene_type:complete